MLQNRGVGGKPFKVPNIRIFIHRIGEDGRNAHIYDGSECRMGDVEKPMRKSSRVPGVVRRMISPVGRRRRSWEVNPTYIPRCPAMPSCRGRTRLCILMTVKPFADNQSDLSCCYRLERKRKAEWPRHPSAGCPGPVCSNTASVLVVLASASPAGFDDMV